MTSSTLKTVPVSGLPDYTSLKTLDGGDHLIINDNEGALITTNKIKLEEVIGFIEATDLTFTGEVTFLPPSLDGGLTPGQIHIGGNVVPSPGTELGITANYLTIRQELNVEDFVVVTGLELNDLEDVDYDRTNITSNQALLWDDINEVFVNGDIDSSPVYFDQPLTPREGDLWWRKDNGRLYVYYKSTLSGFSQWVQSSGTYVYN